jgi:hypothetical protein
LDDESTRSQAKSSFLATKRSINPLEPVYQLPGGGSTIPAGTDVEVSESEDWEKGD